MPVLPSKVITYKLKDKAYAEPYLLRTHQIAIYPQETEKVLKLIKLKKGSSAIE